MILSLIKRKGSLLACAAIVTMGLQACNKEFEEVPVPPVPQPGTTSLSQILDADPSFSILKAAVTRAGLLTAFGATDTKYTVFAPDDAAFAASGLSLTAVNALPPAQLQAILTYHVIPQAIPSAQVPVNQFNLQMPTLLQLPGGNPLIKNSIFPSRRGTQLYVNNISVRTADIQVGGTVVHKVAALVLPPSQLIGQIIDADPNLSILKAAIVRADSGQVGLNRLDSVIRFGVANVTVFAPTNDAFRALFPPGTPDAFIIGALNTPQAFTAQTVRGIIAYHMLGSRAFGVNLPATPTFIPTLLNGAVPSHPGVRVEATFAGPVPTAVTLLGVGNRGAVANIITRDLNAVNGIVHKIDRVLLPQ